MKQCRQCGKTGLFLRTDGGGICKTCQEFNKNERIKRRNNEINEAKKFISEYVEMVQLATEHSLVLPHFGQEAIKKQRIACRYVLDHIDDWRSINRFKDAFTETAYKTERGYEHPLFNYTIFREFNLNEIERAFNNLKKEVDNIYTKCLIAEYKAYDYSELYNVVGVTFKNGRRHRQTILRQIKFKDPPYSRTPTFRLERYLFEGEDAVAVYANDEQVGHISKINLPWLLDNWDNYYKVTDFEVVGGGRGYSYGLWIRVCFRNKQQ